MGGDGLGEGLRGFLKGLDQPHEAVAIGLDDNFYGIRTAIKTPVALEQLSKALQDDIGGSMGPLYGNFFLGLAETLGSHPHMDAGLYGEAVAEATARVGAMGRAQVGDKTLMDTLTPALAAYQLTFANGGGFVACLQAMSAAASTGRDSTRNLQARIGRAARLGPRSVGVLDAGASSCCLILQTLAVSLQRKLEA